MMTMRLTNGKTFDSYTPRPNELYKKLLTTPLTSDEHLIIDFVERNTIGYKHFDSSDRLAERRMSYRTIEKETGIAKSTAQRTVKRLLSRYILLRSFEKCWIKDKNGIQQRHDISVLGINFDFWQWDSKMDYLEHSEYKKLQKRGCGWLKDILKEFNYIILPAKKREGVDFKISRHGVASNVVVIVKPGWDGKEIIPLQIKDPKPNTHYFFVNRELTSYLRVYPKAVDSKKIVIAQSAKNLPKHIYIPKNEIKHYMKTPLPQEVIKNDFAPNPEGHPRSECEGIVI